MKRILIVDDEKPIREWIASCLSNCEKDYAIQICRNGEEALKLLEKSRFNVVLTDITMPKINGIDLLNIIKSKSPETVVVMISMHNEFEYARSALKLGAYDYILKNEISKETLIQLLERIESENVTSSNSDEERHNYERLKKSDYVQQLLIDKGLIPTVKSCLEHYITLAPENVFVWATDRLALSITAAELEDPAIENLNIIDLGNSLLFLANILRRDLKFLNDKIIRISSKTGQRIGGSKIKYSLGELTDAIREAMAMRSFQFYDKDSLSHPYLRSLEEVTVIKNELIVQQNDIIAACNLHHYDKVVERIQAYLDYLELVKCLDIGFVRESIINFVHCVLSSLPKLTMDVGNVEKEILNADYFKTIQEQLEPYIQSISEIRQYSPTVAQSLKYIDENYMNQISLTDVSKRMNYSDEHFSRVFKKETGENFTQYLTGVRMNQAKMLVTRTDYSIDIIAQMVGIPNAKYFSLLFKKHLKMTPLQMRERL